MFPLEIVREIFEASFLRIVYNFIYFWEQKLTLSYLLVGVRKLQTALFVCLKKQELYEKLEKWREDYNKEMMEIVEKCREIEQSSREAFNAMIDEKRQRGKIYVNNHYLYFYNFRYLCALSFVHHKIDSTLTM